MNDAPAYGAHRPGLIDGAVIAATSRLPNTWLGLRLAIGLRRIVTMRMQPGGGLDVERWGLRMRLHPRDNGCEKGLLFTPQMYEVRERAALAAAIVEGRRPFVFVDIGANVGLFSLFVAATVAPAARIIAVEPEPENLRRLRFNVAANPGLPIAVLPVALDEVAGMVAIEANYRDRGGTRTRPAEHGTVEALTLFEALKREGASYIDALKIDVEGAEDRILVPFFRDAPVALWPRLVIIEDSRDSWRVDLFRDLADRGYVVAARTRQNVILRRPAGCGGAP